MIKHLVMWTLKDHAEGASKAENIRKMKAMLEALPKAIPEIRTLEVGVNFLAADFAADVALASEFATRADLDVYQKHPEHVKVAGFIGKIRKDRYVADYEV